MRFGIRSRRFSTLKSATLSTKQCRIMILPLSSPLRPCHVVWIQSTIIIIMQEPDKKKEKHKKMLQLRPQLFSDCTRKHYFMGAHVPGLRRVGSVICGLLRTASDCALTCSIGLRLNNTIAGLRRRRLSAQLFAIRPSDFSLFFFSIAICMSAAEFISSVFFSLSHSFCFAKHIYFFIREN